MLSAEDWERIRRDAQRIATEVALESLEGSDRRWAPVLDVWGPVRATLTEIAEACGVDSNARAGLISVFDWRDCAELRRLLAKVPVVTELIDVLGQEVAPEPQQRPTILESEGGPILRSIEREAPVHELSVVEIRGVERSEEVARMLASEAVLRARPTTKLLWHARRAERMLLTYHAASVHTNRITTEAGFREGVQQEHERAGRGPIVLILDTSSSMTGASEAFAKALVMQIGCVAHLQRRRLFLYNFGGAGQLIEHELSLDQEDGLARVIAVLSTSFSGGTNIHEALRRATRRLGEPDWRRADLVIVTDGWLDHPEHPFDRSTIHAVQQMRKAQSTQVHVALTVPLDYHGVHPWYWEDSDEPASPYIGDPHWVIKVLADHIHQLAHLVAHLERDA
ncbi:MAG: VWA domain-containing protein [Myxococcales bacterium]|nr:VWA domain-containing protein [Myxococcales bacterium]